MNRVSRHSLCMVAIMLAGCGGAQTGVSGAVPQGVTSDSQAHRAPGSYNKILYAYSGGTTTMLSYPELQILGKISPGESLYPGCADDVTGNIYFGANVGSTNELLEYPYGGTQQIGSIQPPSGFVFGTWCSVDPSTGNLAVITQKAGTNLAGYVAIYPLGSGQPKDYSDPSFKYYDNLAYDGAGDLFVVGERLSSPYAFLAELPKGSSTFTNLTLSEHVPFGPIQWDGKHLADQQPRFLHETPLLIYRISVSGSTATVVGKTQLNNAKSETWIESKTAISGQWGKGNKSHIAFYHYPRGGKSYEIYTGLPPQDVFSFNVLSTPSH